MGRSLASSTDGQKNWKFVDMDKVATKILVERIILAEILE